MSLSTYSKVQQTNTRRVIFWVLRIFIGTILVASAVGKALDFSGFVLVLQTYEAFPSILLWPVAVVAIVIEAVLGLWMLSGWRLATSALMAAGLNGLYAIWMTVTLLRGLELDNCGCFGVFLQRPLTWTSPLEDLVMVGFCYWLSRLAR